MSTTLTIALLQSKGRQGPAFSWRRVFATWQCLCGIYFYHRRVWMLIIVLILILSQMSRKYSSIFVLVLYCSLSDSLCYAVFTLTHLTFYWQDDSCCSWRRYRTSCWLDVALWARLPSTGTHFGRTFKGMRSPIRSRRGTYSTWLICLMLISGSILGSGVYESGEKGSGALGNVCWL